MVRTYGAVHRHILDSLYAVNDLLAKAQREGVTPSPAWLWQQQRYQEMLRTAEGEMRDFAGSLHDADLTPVVRMGIAESKELTSATLAGLPKDERARLLSQWGKLDPRVIEQAMGFLEPSSPIWKSLDQFGPAMRTAIEDVVVRSLAMGYNPKKWAADLRDVTGRGLDWALNWARTVQLMIYREAARQTWLNNPEAVTGWIWSSALDDRTCASCWAMHGTVHPMSERLEDHWRGRCAAIPQGPTYADLGFVGIEEPPPVRRGEDVFADLDEATQRKILGPKYEPWKEGKFEFGALSREVNDATWGPMRVEATLKSLLGEGGE